MSMMAGPIFFLQLTTSTLVRSLRLVMAWDLVRKEIANVGSAAFDQTEDGASEGG